MHKVHNLHNGGGEKFAATGDLETTYVKPSEEAKFGVTLHSGRLAARA
jgi:hypothetical protein